MRTHTCKHAHRWNGRLFTHSPTYKGRWAGGVMYFIIWLRVKNTKVFKNSHVEFIKPLKSSFCSTCFVSHPELFCWLSNLYSVLFTLWCQMRDFGPRCLLLLFVVQNEKSQRKTLRYKGETLQENIFVTREICVSGQNSWWNNQGRMIAVVYYDLSQ